MFDIKQYKPNIGVIFDCDGTLIDSMQVWHNIDELLGSKSKREFTRADQDYFTGATLEECGIYSHEQLGIGDSPQDVVDMILARMEDYYKNEAELKPGVRQFVEGLYETGVPMSVASSTSAHMLDLGLKRTGLYDMMKGVFSTDHVNAPKRFPYVYNAARDVMGTSTKNTWGVEDAIYAVRTLNNAGYNTLGIYDSDIAGTAQDLQSETNKFIMTFDGYSAAEFLDMAYNLNQGH